MTNRNIATKTTVGLPQTNVLLNNKHCNVNTCKRTNENKCRCVCVTHEAVMTTKKQEHEIFPKSRKKHRHTSASPRLNATKSEIQIRK